MAELEAVRRGEGLIILEDDSAEQVKQVIESVSKITAIDGNKTTFEGQRIIEGHGFALEVNSFDLFECPDGYLLHTYMDTGPNWAVSGKTLPQTLDAAPDRRVARRTHGLLIQKNLISPGH